MSVDKMCADEEEKKKKGPKNLVQKKKKNRGSAAPLLTARYVVAVVGVARDENCAGGELHWDHLLNPSGDVNKLE